MTWTEETALRALRRFIREHGRQPTSNEVEARSLRLGLPGRRALVRIFGSWGAAMEAAGGVARRPGEYPRTPAAMTNGQARQTAASPINKAGRPDRTTRQNSRDGVSSDESTTS